jgi:hypothetical protein
MNRSRPPPVVLAIEGPVARSEIPCLCACMGPVLSACAGDELVCDVGRAHPDLVLVEALVRLQLTAARLGGRVLLRSSPPGLDGLLVLLGLAGVFPRIDGDAEASPSLML